MYYYSFLKIKRTATADEIKKAYKKIASENHPDRTNGDSEKTKIFKQVVEAYETLFDPLKRARYNSLYPEKVHFEPPKPFSNMAKPPTHDIWGEPLSYKDQMQWLRENDIRNIEPAWFKFHQEPKPEPKPEKKDKEKGAGVDFYNEEPKFTKQPINGMHFHNPNDDWIANL